MAKNIVLTILTLFLFTDSFCQNGRIIYEFKEPSLTRKSNTVNGQLEFKDSSTLFTYYKVSLEDSGRNISRTYLDPNKGAIFQVSPFDEKGMQVYRNFKDKIIVLRQSKVKPLEPFIINDNWLPIDWKITKKKKTILGYECLSAIGNFRGREYTAWFTYAIPVPFGPWKFFGLPGLILEAYDKEDMVHLTAKRIVYPDTSTIVLQAPMEEKVKNIIEFAHYEDFYIEHVDSAFQQTVPKGVTFRLSNKDRTTPEKIKFERAYKIEKEYEWEHEKQPESKVILKMK
jgi:GLPGLI family protein